MKETDVLRSKKEFWAAYRPALLAGSLWGLAEVTAGHLLHLGRIPGLPGFVMFPVGLYLMFRAFKDSGKPAVVFLTSVIAASLKLADFLIPDIVPSAILRPALAILCEGLAGTLFFLLTAVKMNRFMIASETSVGINREDTIMSGGNNWSL